MLQAAGKCLLRHFSVENLTLDVIDGGKLGAGGGGKSQRESDGRKAGPPDHSRHVRSLGLNCPAVVPNLQ
jgi:hypothetical protein